eukprot:14462103-Ditylum_brightwellii.AAC.1
MTLITNAYHFFMRRLAEDSLLGKSSQRAVQIWSNRVINPYARVKSAPPLFFSSYISQRVEFRPQPIGKRCAKTMELNENPTRALPFPTDHIVFRYVSRLDVRI